MKSYEDEEGAAFRGVHSIEMGARLLQVLAAATGPMQLRDIAAAASITASKAHRYLTSLISVGLVEPDSTRGKYDLGPMSMSLGLAALSRRKAIHYATEAMIEFSQKADVNVALAIWGERGPTIIGWHDSSNQIISNIGLGSILDLLRTAGGRVFLAYQPRAITRRLVDKELGLIAAYSPHEKITTWADVDELIKEVRASGVGLTHGNVIPGSSAAAAPIFDHQGRIVAAMLQIGPTKQIHSNSLPASESLLAITQAVSHRLGYSGTPFVDRVERLSHADSR
jgi:DNA-binding IclR family transcriptional regulator